MAAHSGPIAKRALRLYERTNMGTQNQSERSCTTREAARLLGLWTFRLQEMQRLGEGPEFTGKGARVGYSAHAVKKWVLETHCVSLARLNL